jgi:RNA polymerase sigma-70 factor, ECF subfamily
LEEPSGDRELIERCRAGSEAAFRELVDSYKRLVFSMISRSIADRNRVEDLAQEVFLRVHRGLPYFRGDARLSTWICRIVMNVCADNRARGVRDLSLDDEQAGAPVRVATASVDRSFGDLELRDRLTKALARLPERARLLVSLHYLGGRGYEEIAAECDIPLGTVKTQLHRAKRDLRKLLEPAIGKGSR